MKACDILNANYRGPDNMWDLSKHMDTKDIKEKDIENSMYYIKRELEKPENINQLNVVFFFISGEGITK